MKTIEFKIILTTAIVVFSIVSGIWLSKTGRPLNTGIFTLHKLVSLAAIVLLALTVYNLQKGTSLDKIELWLIGLTALFIILSLVSGGFLSFEKPDHFIALTVHRITAVLTLISGIVMIYMLFKNK